jgi:hypothetical protein
MEWSTWGNLFRVTRLGYAPPPKVRTDDITRMKDYQNGGC